ncbi:MAG: hypothetical protein ACOCQD_03260 [archaeon]
MGFLYNYFGNRSYLNLAEENDKGNVRPKTVDSTSTSDKSTKETIKDLIENDWFTFATKNLCTTMFSKVDTEIISPDKEKYEKFFKQMRFYGNNTSERRLKSDIKGDMIAYGSGFIEYIFDEEGTELVDLKRIDASKINVAKDKKGHLILDRYGNSIGYILSLGPNADLRSKGDPIPEGYDESVNLQHGDIFLLPYRIGEIKLYTRPNGIESIGLIEPSIKQTNRRKDLETAQVNAIWIRGTAPIFASVGDPTHEPNTQMITDALDSLVEMKSSNVSAFPYYMEPKTLDTNVDDMATKISESLLSASASSAGIPLPFITGQGEATNRATLKTQREMFEDNIQDKIKNFDEDWKLLVLDKISQYNGLAPAEVKSSNIRLEGKDEFAKRLKLYFDMSALTPREIRMNIKNSDDLELDDEDFEKNMKEKEEMKKKDEESSEESEDMDKDTEEEKEKKRDEEEEK